MISSLKPTNAVLASAEAITKHNDHETKGTFVDARVTGWQELGEDLGLEI